MGSTSDKPGRSGPPGTLGEDALLKASVTDAIRLSEKRRTPRFTGFLDERQRAVAEAILRRQSVESYAFRGGYPDAERNVLGIFPAGQEPDNAAFPLTALGFRYRAQASLSHRDVLGTLLSCGVKRETIGDILCGEGLAVAFVDTRVVPYLSCQIETIGGEGVQLCLDYEGELPAARCFEIIRDTVASPRLDAVVKIAAGMSRETAARRIEAGQVLLNHAPCLSISATVKAGDVLSVRGTGRFVVDELGPPSRKGRLFVTIRKYC